jgi:hypothetical protein
MTDATTPQKRAALSEPRVGAYTEKQLSEVRRHHADTPCVITGTHETCRLLATVKEREEALQRVLAICANPPWCADAGGRKNLEAVKAALEGATHE